MCKGRINIIRILVVSLLFLFSLDAKPDSSDVHRQAGDFIEQQLQSILLPSDEFDYQINPIDHRLNLDDCSTPLTFETPRTLSAGSFSIKATCTSPQFWSIYLRGDINIQRKVVVASQSLPKGINLQPQNLKLLKLPLEELRGGYFTRFDELNNYVLRRPISKDEVFTPQLLQPPLLIKKGDEVIISAGRTTSIEVRVPGVAMQDGRLNQQIAVKNAASGRQIKARVIGRGEVRADY